MKPGIRLGINSSAKISGSWILIKDITIITYDNKLCLIAFFAPLWWLDYKEDTTFYDIKLVIKLSDINPKSLVEKIGSSIQINKNEKIYKCLFIYFDSFLFFLFFRNTWIKTLKGMNPTARITIAINIYSWFEFM